LKIRSCSSAGTRNRHFKKEGEAVNKVEKRKNLKIYR
jgi:hypothetical protein